MHPHASLSSGAALLIAAALTVTTSASALAVPVSPARRDVPPGVQDTAYASRTSDGAVTLTVQPRWEDGTLFVDIRANTHTVPLSTLDLGTQVRLILGSDSIAPEKAGELSGHHAAATLEFSVERRPSSFTIEFRDVPDVPLRTLTWPVADGVRDRGRTRNPGRHGATPRRGSVARLLTRDSPSEGTLR